MYKHVREVRSGLVLSLVLWAIMAAVAIIDPWGNGVPWANWVSLSVVSTLCVGASTGFAISATEQKDESLYWGGPLIALVFWGLIAGYVVGISTSTEGGLDPAYRSLAWTIFAVPFLVLPLACLVQYLAGASAANRDDQQNHLRRVA